MGSNLPFRSTGSSAAARMFPTISARALRRAPRTAGSNAGDSVHVVSAHRQRDLCELGPVERPVDLDRRDVGRQQPCQRHALHIVVAGRRRDWRHDPRQRRERSEAACCLLESRCPPLDVRRRDVGGAVDGQAIGHQTRVAHGGDYCGLVKDIDWHVGDCLQPRFSKASGNFPNRQTQPGEIRHREPGNRNVAGEPGYGGNDGDRRRQRRRGADDTDFASVERRGERGRRRIHMHLEYAHERGARTVQPTPHVVSHGADGDEVTALENGLRVLAVIMFARRHALCERLQPCHGLHPCLIRSQCSSARRAASATRRDLLRPRAREPFGRPFARGIDPHLAAVGRQVARVLEVVHRPARELNVPFRIVVRTDDPRHLGPRSARPRPCRRR